MKEASVGILVLISATAKQKCQNTFQLNIDRIEHFKRRCVERGLNADEVVIVILNVDDIHGGPLAEVLMPNTNWQEFRDRGEIPFARGLTERKGIQKAISFFDKEAENKLRTMTGLAIVVVDHGVAEIFSDSLVSFKN